ncbi:GNAT family N-acetyltransferase [Streptomyces aurantiacus]|uniref:Putative Mycothiol acetyltransferase n=1 Tax=Streptomyces aurantiacus JA 4570 TaxID=1286094 RepID=S4A575_9ACTN|nr:GNAT family N-acetyltransferase [Streptomyces aurantiacus]EPH45905.1 putative Mycothiol acetyltransferase [Streptomyces aurantiacus JA 4570]
MNDNPVHIRPGGPADIPLFLAILDSAVEGLVARGRTGQWGTQPLSRNPKVVESIEKYVADGSPWLAEVDGEAAGMLMLTDGPGSYIPPVEEPEQYVHYLATDPRFAGRGVGRALLTHAAAETRRQGISLLRVDCYAGNEGKLVAYYESNGFVRTETFTEKNGTWPGQVLEMRL